jgi:acyl-coenzyme A synthetase/AMP-(fatty) acid ligase
VKILDDAGHELLRRTEGVYFEPGPRPSVISGDPEKTAAAFGIRRSPRERRMGRHGWLPVHLGAPPSVIVSAGVNVYPAVIEAALDGVPGVADLCVVSGPDGNGAKSPSRSSSSRPATTPRPSSGAAAPAHDQIAAYERPRDAIAWDELPRDETGKLLRRRVRDAIWGDSSPFAVGSGDAHTPT